MDRSRFLIAIALSITVLVGWQLVMQRFSPPAPAPPPRPSSESLPAEEAEEQAQVEQPKKTPQPAPSLSETQVPPREITVTTPYWRIIFTNQGAATTSWMLRARRAADGSLLPITGAGGEDLELTARQMSQIVGPPLRLRTPWAPELGDALNRKNFKIEGLAPDQSSINVGPGDAPQTITFIYSSPEVSARKSFTFYGDRFVFGATAEVTKFGEQQPVQIVLGPRFGDQSHKQTGSYATPPQVIAHDKLGNTERVVAGQITPPFAEITAVDHATGAVEIDHPLASGVDQVKLVGADEATFIGYSRVLSRESGSRRLKLENMPAGIKPGDRVAQGTDTLRKGYRWAALVDHYFAFTAIPEAPLDELVLTNFQVKQSSEDDTLLDCPSLAVPMQPGATTHFFVGPKDRHVLSEVGSQVRADLGPLIDYGMFAFAIRPLIPVIEWALNGSRNLFNNYGWGIVLVTVVINLALSPLRFYSSKKMKNAARHQPKIKELQDRMKKLKENPKKNQREIEQVQREQMELMREANPLGGCLPLVLQMPIFWAFFVYLTISLDVRHAPWILWIQDLSAPDPYKILPIIMCVTMIGSTMLQPMPPTTDPSQKMQRLMMTWLMPLVLTWFFFFSAPSGLVLYWMVSNVVGVVIQLGINKMTTEPTAAVEPSKPSPKKLREGERYPRKRSSEA